MAEEMRLKIVVEGMEDLKKIETALKAIATATGKLEEKEKKLTDATKKVAAGKKEEASEAEKVSNSLSKQIGVYRDLNSVSEKFHKTTMQAKAAQEQHLGIWIKSKISAAALTTEVRGLIDLLVKEKVEHRLNASEIGKEAQQRQNNLQVMKDKKKENATEIKALKAMRDSETALADVKQRMLQFTYEEMGAGKKRAKSLAEQARTIDDLKQSIKEKQKVEERAAREAEQAAKKKLAQLQREREAEQALRQSFRTKIQGLRTEAAELGKVANKTKTLSAAKGVMLEQSLRAQGATAAEAREMVKYRKAIDAATAAIKRRDKQPPRPPTPPRPGDGRRGGPGNTFALMGASMTGIIKGWGKALITIAAIQRAVRQLWRGMTMVVRSAIDMAKELERGRIRLAAILANTEMMGKTYKNVEEAGKGYADQLARADVLQRKILVKSTEVVGTSKELIEMHSRVVALSGRQVASDNERIDFASTLLTITRAMGLQGEKALTEARQLFELNRLQGQTVLQTLQINIQDAREWKRKGVLMQEYNKRFLVFLAAQQDMALTWENLNESLRVFSRLMLSSLGAEQFEAGKNFLTGFRDALRENEASLKKQADHAKDIKNAIKAAAKEGAPWWLQRERRDDVAVTETGGRAMIGGVPAAPGTTMAQHKAAAESMKRTLDEDLATSIEKIGRAIGNLFTKSLEFVAVLTGNALSAFGDPESGWEAKINAMTAALQRSIDTAKKWDTWMNRTAGYVQSVWKMWSLLTKSAAFLIQRSVKMWFAAAEALFKGLWERLDPLKWAMKGLQQALGGLKKNLPMVFEKLDIGGTLSAVLAKEIDAQAITDRVNPSLAKNVLTAFTESGWEAWVAASAVAMKENAIGAKMFREDVKELGVALGITNPELLKHVKLTEKQLAMLKKIQDQQKEIDLDKKRGGGPEERSAKELKDLASAEAAWKKELKRLDMRSAKLKMNAVELRKYETAMAVERANEKKFFPTRKQINEMNEKRLKLLREINEETIRKAKETDTEALILLKEQNKVKMQIRDLDMQHLNAREQQFELELALYRLELESQMLTLEGGKKQRRFDDEQVRHLMKEKRLTHDLDKQWSDHIKHVEDSSLDLVEIFDKAFTSIEDGAKGLEDFFGNVGKNMVKKFAKSFLFGKVTEWELPFKANVSSVFGETGLIGSLFGKGGKEGANNFGGGFNDGFMSLFGGGGNVPASMGPGTGSGGDVAASEDLFWATVRSGQHPSNVPGGMRFQRGRGWVGGGGGGRGGVGDWGGFQKNMSGLMGGTGGGIWGDPRGSGPWSLMKPSSWGQAGSAHQDPEFFEAAFGKGPVASGQMPMKMHGSAGMGGAAVSGLASLAGYEGIGGHIGSTIGTMAMSIQPIAQAIGAMLGNTLGAFANFIVPGIGFLIGFGIEKLLGALLKPGRINQDKKMIKKYAKEIGLEGVDPQGSKSVTLQHQQADVEFAGQQGGLSALSLMYVDLDDKISHVFGTMKRFTNQFQVGFLEAGLTMEEANEKVLELAEKMGFKITTVVKQINRFATETNIAEFNEELAETANSGNEMLYLADMLEGAIEVATRFNPLIDATALSNRYLADAFEEAAEKAGVTEDQITSLGDKIRSGDLDVEKAIGELHDLGITSLKIGHIQLDEKQIEEELERAMEQSATALKGISSAFAAGIQAGLQGGDVAEAAEAGFREVFRKALQEKAMADFIEDNMEDWFEGFDFTQPIDTSSEAFNDLAKEIGLASDQLYDLLEAAGLLPDTIKAGDENLRALNSTLAQVRNQIIDTQLSFAANLVAVGALGSIDLQQMKHTRTSSQLQMHRGFNLHEGGVWNAMESTEQGLRAWAMAFANMRQAVVDLFQARESEEHRLSGEVIDGINERREADLKANSAQVDAANERIAALREERNEIAQIAQEAGQLAQKFESSAEGIAGMIRNLATGSDAFSIGEQLGFLQREEALLRQQLVGAEDEDQPGLFSKLSANLVAQLEMSRNQGTELTDETNATLQELERIQGEALAGAALQRSIEEAMELELKSIDGRLEEQTDLITFYQKEAIRINEEAAAAVEAEQERSTAAIDAMRIAVVAELDSLHENEMHVWQGIALHVKEGKDIDTKLHKVLQDLDDTLNTLNATLGAGRSAAAGYSGMVSQPTWFQVAERGPEHVEVTPSGSVPGPLHLTVAPTINVGGGANGKAVGQQVYRQIEDGIIRSMESGRLRGVLKKGH